MMSSKCLRPLPLIIALQAAFSLSANAANFVVADGSTNNNGQILATGETGNVNAGGTLSTSGGTVAVTINRGTTSITNAGTIAQTGTARTIDANDGTPNVVIKNEIGGVISAVGNVVIRMNRDAGSFTINNQGTIQQVGVDVGGERAIKADANYSSTGNQIINGSTTNRNAVISSTGNDALRLGSNVTLVNYGNIFSTGRVNTNCPGYIDASFCPSSAPSASDGVAIENGRSNVTILNHGTITGPRHGVDGGDPVAKDADANLVGVDRLIVTSTGPNGVTFDQIKNGLTTSNVKITNPVIINYEDGVITGNNGSGVGLDGHGVVINYGTISGKYAGAGNVYDRSNGLGLTSSNGDGDGVDIDGVAYIENYGRIEGLGAGGLDSGGEPNGSDGIAAGGGTIINHAGASIYGESKGILIDDGSDGRSISEQRGTPTTTGVAAKIFNSGHIEGGKEAAIGLLGNFNDVIVNEATGVIIGGADAELLGRPERNMAPIPGAAIQMGAGNDTLTNYGLIEGKNGLAIDMGDGNDTLRLFGGTVIGKIDGGSGTNLLETRGTYVFEAGQLSNFQDFHVQAGSLTLNYALGNAGTIAIDNGTRLLVNGAFNASGNLTVDGTLVAPAGDTFRTINVAGDYTQSSTGVLETRIGANGAGDKIVVGGTATLASGATINATAAGYVEKGTRYTLIDAQAMNATASNLLLNINANSNFLTYTLERDGNDLVLVAHREKSMNDLLTGSLSGAVSAVKELLSKDSQKTIALLNTLEYLTNTEAASRAARKLAPENNASSSQVSMAAQGSVFSAFDNRMDAARSGDTSALNSQTGLSSGDGTRGRMWIQGLAAIGKQKARNGANGYDVDAQGMAVGYEKDLNTRDMIGFSGGYTQAGTDGRDNGVGNDNKVKSVHAGGYFSRTDDKYTLDASLAVSANRYRAQRVVDIGSFNETLHGKFNGTQVGARFEYGLPFAIDNKWNGRWLMGARLARLDNGAYTENGGVTAQSIGSSHANSAQSVLGVEFRNRIDNTSSATLRARYLHEFADTPAVNATFVVGGPSFQVDGVQPGRNALQLGVGYRKTTASGTVISFGYDVETRARYVGHQLTAKAIWSF